jgi:hypothetical protein
MSIETLDDIIEQLADQLGKWGCGNPDDQGNHPDDCDCRMCFTCGLRTRIERAVEVEQALNAHAANKPAGGPR